MLLNDCVRDLSLWDWFVFVLNIGGAGVELQDCAAGCTGRLRVATTPFEGIVNAKLWGANVVQSSEFPEEQTSTSLTMSFFPTASAGCCELVM